MTNIESDQTKFVELSHTIRAGMITYQGLPGPEIYDHLTREESRRYYAEDTEFHIGMIEMVANTGTYIDSPFHRFEQGSDLSCLPMNLIANLECVLVRFLTTKDRMISEEDLFGIEIQGKAVLIHTGWDRHWGSENYFEDHPYLSTKAAEYLKDSGAILVGIDSYNIDDIQDGHRPAHTILLEANIPIVEHLTKLDQLPDNGFKFFAVPPKIVGLGSFPVRAFAIIN